MFSRGGIDAFGGKGVCRVWALDGYLNYREVVRQC